MPFAAQATFETRFNSDGSASDGTLITDLTALKVGLYNQMLNNTIGFVKGKAPGVVAAAKNEYFSLGYCWGGYFSKDTDP